MYGIDKIVLGLENCESVTIDGKHLGIFDIEDLTTSIRRTACNSFDKMTITKKVVIEVNRKANVIGDGLFDKKKIFDRLCEWNDITSITIYYDEFQEDGTYLPNGVVEVYYPEWEGERDEINDIQSTKITRQGDLRIAIMKEYKEEDYFDSYETLSEEISDTNLHWTLLE